MARLFWCARPNKTAAVTAYRAARNSAYASSKTAAVTQIGAARTKRPNLSIERRFGTSFEPIDQFFGGPFSTKWSRKSDMEMRSVVRDGHARVPRDARLLLN